MITETLHLADGPAQQIVLPGADRSAHQAAQARGDMMRARRPQLDPGGLFAPIEPHQRALLGDDGR